MSAYQFAEIAGKLSIVIGLALMAFAFLLPKGWKSLLGLLMLALGAGIVAASIAKTGDGSTYAHMILLRAMRAY